MTSMEQHTRPTLHDEIVAVACILDVDVSRSFWAKPDDGNPVAHHVEQAVKLAAQTPYESVSDDPNVWWFINDAEDREYAPVSALTVEQAHDAYVSALAEVCVLLEEAHRTAAVARDALIRGAELQANAGAGV